MRRLLFTALAAGLFACSGPTRPNVLLISVDTLRADYVGAYGDPRGLTPNLDALAAAGVRFHEVVSPVPLTLPAHSSMLTGLIPPRHGVHDNLGYALGDEARTLAEALDEAGYDTGAVISSFVLDAQFNLAQGFDSYDDDFEEEHKIAFLSERKGDEAARHAVDWLGSRDDDPFFLFLHFYDPHDDYAPPEPFATTHADDLYAGEVAYTDQLIGDVLDALRELGYGDDTVIVVTGDHGEMLGEHGEPTHGYFVYESALRVPLIVSAPGVAPAVREERVGIIDIAPTIASLAGVELAPGVDGRDLFAPEPPSPRRELYFESVTANRYYGLATLQGLVSANWKYIETHRPELYDLAADPSESENLADERADLAQELRDRLLELAPAESGEEASALDEETRRRLASLGYIDSGASDSATRMTDGEDPKDYIALFRDHQRLEKLVGAGDYDEARTLAERLLATHPDFLAGYLQLARIATATRDLPSAVRHYESALEIDPDNAGVHYNLANLLDALGRSAEARTHHERAAELDPSVAPATGVPTLERAASGGPAAARELHQEALRLRAGGKLPDAERTLREALRLDPSLAIAQSDLGVVLRQLGRPDEALQHYRTALELDPTLAEAHNNVGSLLGSRGAIDDAIASFRRAVDAEPGHAQARNNLALALRMTGRRDEAIPHLRAALEARPGWAVPANELAWILATHPDAGSRSPDEAIRLAEQAVAATSRSQPLMLDTLGAAYAAAGRFPDASRVAQEAIDVASSRAPRLVPEMRRRLELYRGRRAFVEPRQTRAAPK